jgi:peptidoglycan/xylan/chitin deacetylase (PgdA/CDA1 family)
VIRPAVTLVYHGIERAADGADPARLMTAPEHLQAHIRYLQRRRYRFLTAEELLAEGEPTRGTAVLTFDDGYRNWLTGAVPVLQHLGVRATFYVCPGLWGAQFADAPGAPGRLVTEAEARDLYEAGMELGSHSLSHMDLRRLDDAALADELRESKLALERVTGRPCRTFAYPFGLYDDRVVAATGEAGYELAFAWGPGPWRPLVAPRLPAPPRHGATRLALKLYGVRRRVRLPL